MRCFILTPTHRVVHGIPEVHLYGVLESGEPCLIIDDRVRPYFFVRRADRDRALAVHRQLRWEPCGLRTFAGEPVVRVEVGVPADVPPLRRRLEEAGVACFEADVRFAYRYMIDRRIRGAVEVDGWHAPHERLGRVYRNPVLRPCRWHPALKVLSLDIETSLRGDQVYSIALHGCGTSKVLIVHRDQALEHAEVVSSEHTLISRFLGYLDALDPDVLTGWNVVDFDLALLARAARRHGTRFTVGRTEDEFDCRRDPSFARESRAIVFGRLVLDAISLMRGAFMRLEDYKLETAARELLGRGKLLSGDHRGREIERLYQEQPQRLVEYNLEDARLVSDILEKTRLIDLAIERSLITGMPLDRVSASIAAVDSLYLAALRERGLVAPSVQPDAAARIAGGYVMDPLPGLYRNVLVFDFKSLYPSVIRTFNLDPITLEESRQPAAAAPQPQSPGCPDSSILIAPNGARFRRTPPGILPALVAELAQEREAARRAGQAAKAQAIKILMNSLYGVLGASASRLFAPAVANAVTHFGQSLIRAAAAFVESCGLQVLYGDTDSLFVRSDRDDPQEALALAERLRSEIESAVARHVREQYGCESFLELELEKLYGRFFLPELRSGKGGSKKRYAGLLVGADGRERMELVGLESVRRDWSEVSRRFQVRLLDLVFHDQPVENFIRAFVDDLRCGRLDAELVYRKAVRKPLALYTKTTPPHVQAARKQRGPAARLIEYVVTRNGPEPAGEETAPPDYEHYVEHQIKPVADSILRFLGTDFDRVARTRKQLSLF